MQSRKAKNHWEQWFKKNLHHFNYQPILTETLTNGFVYQFKGIRKQISLVITFDTYCESMIWFNDAQGKNFDHKVIGYESIICSRNKLSHKVFEPIISFVNTYFTSDYKLYLMQYSGVTEAYIEKNTMPIKEIHTAYSILE